MPEHQAAEGRLIDPAEAARHAEALFHSGWNCAESVFQALHRQLASGEPPVHLVTALGGGMASKRTCGALSGAIVAVGLVAGRRAPDDAAKKEAYRLARVLYQEFRDQFQSADCWQLTCEYYDHKDQKQACTRLVRAAAESACRLLKERGPAAP